MVKLRLGRIDYRKLELLLPEIYPEIKFRLEVMDETLERLGFCQSAPCLISFDLDEQGFENLVDDLSELETTAFNTKFGEEPNETDPAYQRYTKYGCLYNILYNAEKIS